MVVIFINNNLSIEFIYNINNIITNFMNNIDKDKIDIYINHNKDNYDNNVIKNLSENDINYIKECIKIASTKLLKLSNNLKNNNKNLDDNVWKICIYKDMFFEFPFTLSDIIFMPYSYIKKNMNNNSNNEFIITLIHERLHIYQRFNDMEWDKYINQNTNWILINNTLHKNCSYYNINIIYNPDTLYKNKIYILKHNNKYYYGELVKKNNSKNIYPLWYKIINSNNILELYPTNEKIKGFEEHPYEDLAYKLSKILMKF